MDTILGVIQSYVLTIYELSGNFGLSWFLAIIAINLYYFWRWWLPRQAEVIDKVPSRLSLVYANIGYAIGNVVFSLFLIGVLFIPQISLWIKILSGVILIAVVVTAIRAILATFYNARA